MSVLRRKQSVQVDGGPRRRTFHLQEVRARDSSRGSESSVRVHEVPRGPRPFVGQGFGFPSTGLLPCPHLKVSRVAWKNFEMLSERISVRA
jgi:hypothetical protein